MADILRATILGCGSSGGVPRLGGKNGEGLWGNCDPDEPKNRRRRCSLLVERIGSEDTTRVLVDAGPDMRAQLLDAKVADLDAVLITHDHADHVHGIDDLRPLVLARKARIDIWTDARTAGALSDRFSYIFEQPPGSPYPPILNLKTMSDSVTIEGAGGSMTAIAHTVAHGERYTARGFRFGGLAYTPDVSNMDEGAWAALEGTDTWIVDALRYVPHPTHTHLERTLEWIERLGPRRAIVTNLHNDLDYATLLRELPKGVEPAHDGMVVEMPCP